MSIPIWLKRIIARLETGYNGYLSQIGWIESRTRRVALDSELQPIPWFTYPAIAIFNNRAHPEWRVLEFGAGMGTIWWARHVREVVCLEHDARWADYVSSRCDANILPTLTKTSNDYIAPAVDTGLYDVVVVDGLYRHECAIAANRLVTDHGIIVLDDAARPQYAACMSA